MFDTMKNATTIGTAVATNGTFTIPYLANRSAGSYQTSLLHKLYINGTLYRAPKDFTISFGSTTATITWLGTATLAVGTVVDAEFRGLGEDDNEPFRDAIDPAIQAFNTVLVSLGSPVAGTSNAISLSQSINTTAALLNGAVGAVLDVPRNVVAAWTGTAVLTVTGKDFYGNVMVEASASGTSFTGKKAFKSITTAVFNANVTAATIGTGNVLGLPLLLTDPSFLLAEFESGIARGRAPARYKLDVQINSTDLPANTAQELVVPFPGKIVGMRSVVQTAVTTGGTLILKVNTVTVAGLTLTIANAATVGTRTSGTATVGDVSAVVAAGDRLEIIPASFATAGSANVEIEIEVPPANQVLGTLVTGNTAASSSTSNDVRGTYAPFTTPTGTVAYHLLIATAEPNNKGAPQFAG